MKVKAKRTFTEDKTNRLFGRGGTYELEAGRAKALIAAGKMEAVGGKAAKAEAEEPKQQQPAAGTAEAPKTGDAAKTPEENK